MDLRAKDQAPQKLREPVHVRGWKPLVGSGAHQGLSHKRPWWP